MSEGDPELLIPESVIEELRRVLIKKIGVMPADYESIVSLLDDLDVEYLPTPKEVEAVSGDPADDQNLAAA